MRVLIAYRTRYGFTARCADLLRERIGGKVDLEDLKEWRPWSVSAYDTVLVGGSVYAGKIQREVPSFCAANREPLLARRVGLFLCCLYEGERAEAQMGESFPAWLLAHAFGCYHLGGELKLASLGLLDRFLIRTVLGQKEDRRLLREESLDELAREARGGGGSE